MLPDAHLGGGWTPFSTLLKSTGGFRQRSWQSSPHSFGQPRKRRRAGQRSGALRCHLRHAGRGRSAASQSRVPGGTQTAAPSRRRCSSRPEPESSHYLGRQAHARSILWDMSDYYEKVDRRTLWYRAGRRTFPLRIL
eukprot:812129-Pyramimonas_sp.AAC.1